MEELIIRKLNCNIPWSTTKVRELKNCTSPTDFQDYFKTVVESQSEILRLPSKCKHSIWRAQHYDEVLYEGSNKIVIGLMTSTKKVTRYFNLWTFKLLVFWVRHMNILILRLSLKKRLSFTQQDISLGQLVVTWDSFWVEAC